MAKRKTRKQKMISDYRRQLSLDKETVTQYSLSSEKLEEAPREKQVVVNINTSSYPYLKGDLTKTGILTFFVISAQIVLFFLLQRHALVLSGLTY
ncbi:MAG: hypothetical protein V1697_00995 [Candidatus Levyibacteriota bacterium]